jgi:phosphodiesterase/alkaline phosphatase D-like protein
MPGQALTQGEEGQIWSEEITSQEAVISARLRQSGPVRVILSEDSLDFSRGRRSSRQVAEAQNFHFLRFSFDDLQAGTDYWYRLEVGGKLDSSRQSTGHFRTSEEDR